MKDVERVKEVQRVKSLDAAPRGEQLIIRSRSFQTPVAFLILKITKSAGRPSAGPPRVEAPRLNFPFESHPIDT
ncbi:hypothetical protein EYF80_044069 [Liparis tanakae]|uniref:Uncharacterized protein n=1 Tax=Liparis tanakae TaxID=230148 RepID=A0A4Z2FWQ3_9TELE|nr:hypothetical protein EYF80_044069 [Liparis tanakae]